MLTIPGSWGRRNQSSSPDYKSLASLSCLARQNDTKWGKKKFPQRNTVTGKLNIPNSKYEDLEQSSKACATILFSICLKSLLSLPYRPKFFQSLHKVCLHHRFTEPSNVDNGWNRNFMMASTCLLARRK
jgi:hypothetical protein